MSGDQSERRAKGLVVCVNNRFRADRASCAARGSVAIADALESGITARRLDVRFERICCLGECSRGPTVRLVPGGEFFFGVTMNEVAAILDAVAVSCGTLEPLARAAALPAPGT